MEGEQEQAGKDQRKRFSSKETGNYSRLLTAVQDQMGSPECTSSTSNPNLGRPVAYDQHRHILIFVLLFGLYTIDMAPPDSIPNLHSSPF